MTVQDFKTFAINEISSTSPSAHLDVEVLLLHKLNLSKTQLLLNRQKELSQTDEIWLKSAITQRKTGLPVAYITGHKEFYGYDFLVNPSTLIPKPDTEILVEKAIDIIIEKMEARPNSLLTVCDMCTGTGCIGISVYKTLRELYKIPENEMPTFTMVDLSAKALELAKNNAERLLTPHSKIRFIQSNLFEMIPQTFDVILSNPPYIPAAMVDQLLQDGRSEPRLALVGDVDEKGNPSPATDGLDIVRRLILQSKEKLSPKGSVIMEAGEYNIESALAFSRQNGFKDLQIINDLSDQKRVLIYHKSK